MSVGYVYILSNKTMPGLLKIGYTNRDVTERVRELSSASGVPTSFDIEYYCLTKDVEEIEAAIHKQFAKQYRKGKEFFSIPLVEAVKMIDTLVKTVTQDRFCRLKDAEYSLNQKFYASCHTIIPDGMIDCPKCGGGKFYSL